MDLTVATEPAEDTFEDEWGNVWTFLVKPMMPTRQRKLMQEAGVKTMSTKIVTPDDLEWMALVSSESFVSIKSAISADGSDVTINGEPAASKGRQALAVEHIPGLSGRIARCAIDLGKAVNGERGNSTPAPA